MKFKQDTEFIKNYHSLCTIISIISCFIYCLINQPFKEHFNQIMELDVQAKNQMCTFILKLILKISILDNSFISPLSVSLSLNYVFHLDELFSP